MRLKIVAILILIFFIFAMIHGSLYFVLKIPFYLLIAIIALLVLVIDKKV